MTISPATALETALAWGASGGIYDKPLEWWERHCWTYQVPRGVVIVSHHSGGPRLHFWCLPGTSPFHVLRIGRQVIPQILAHVPTLYASPIDERLAVLCRRLGGLESDKGRFAWDSAATTTSKNRNRPQSPLPP